MIYQYSQYSFSIRIVISFTFNTFCFSFSSFGFGVSIPTNYNLIKDFGDFSFDIILISLINEINGNRTRFQATETCWSVTVVNDERLYEWLNERLYEHLPNGINKSNETIRMNGIHNPIIWENEPKKWFF